jgi:mannose-6-phosphate isomerase-like protein (cupin superfamily)
VKKIAIDEKFSLFQEYWRPRVMAELNGQEVKLVKCKGEFVWHHHEAADELFLVWRGSFRVEFHDHVVSLNEGEMLVVPRGVEHRTVAEEEAEILVFEPASTLNTGNLTNSSFTAPLGNKI